MRNYSRQNIFDMGKVESAKITIVGGGLLTNYICLYMAGLGIKNLKIIDWEKGNESEFLTGDKQRSRTEQLEEKLLEINGEVKIKTRSNFDENSLGKPDVLVDFSNKKDVRDICRAYAFNNDIPFISGATEEDNGSLCLTSKGMGTSSINHLDNYEKKKQGNFTSGIISSIALDEIRKIIMPIQGDNRLTQGVDFSLRKSRRFNSGNEFNGSKSNASRLKMLIVGAGGIGTYAALNLALMNLGDIDIIDGDRIENHNLNRQVLYYDRIGENKAKTLSDRLKKFSKSKINAIPYYLKDISQITKPYDVIFCCVDNWKWRFELSNYATKNNIKFINGGVTTFSAKAEFSTCLECKYDKSLLINEEREKPGSCNNLNSNVVMQNAFIGALMAAEAKAIAMPWQYNTLKKKEVQYHSMNSDARKFVILDEDLRCQCSKERGCICHGYRN